MTDINTVIARKAEANAKAAQILAQIATNQSSKSNQNGANQ